MYEIEGVSIREIMRRTGYHYKTIKKYLEMQDFNESHYSARDSTSLLDPLKPIIDEWLKNDLICHVNNGIQQSVSMIA